jgi:hypothetical protein
MDVLELWEFVDSHSALGIDTESTGINCYKPGWQLRSVQVGDAHTAYVIPARRKFWIMALMQRDMNWIGHNGPHDIRSIDTHLGYETGVRCAGETYIPAHYRDSRKQEEGGTGHGLKELSVAYVARDAGKWEHELKKAFKEITVPIPGEVYKSGPRKGQQKMRKITLSEGWARIDPKHPAYVAYSAADPLLAYRLWSYLQPYVRENLALYHNDLADQHIADKLHRRAMLVDTSYTRRLSAAFASKAEKFQAVAREYGCQNIGSGQQLAAVLESLGARLTERTASGKQFKTDDKVLRRLASEGNAEVRGFIHAVLGAKQVLKRRENYTEAFLREMDGEGRVHPAINTMAARTTRMSISNPPLQQLPTKDREEDAE